MRFEPTRVVLDPRKGPLLLTPALARFPTTTGPPSVHFINRADVPRLASRVGDVGRDAEVMRLRCVASVHVHTSRWGDYLEQRARVVTDLAGEVRAAVSGPPPGWAAGADATPHGDRAVWQAAYAVPGDGPRPAHLSKAPAPPTSET